MFTLTLSRVMMPRDWMCSVGIRNETLVQAVNDRDDRHQTRLLHPEDPSQRENNTRLVSLHHVKGADEKNQQQQNNYRVDGRACAHGSAWFAPERIAAQDLRRFTDGPGQAQRQAPKAPRPACRARAQENRSGTFGRMQKG